MNWKSKKFKNPRAKIKLATMFSGIGAIEQAFKRLKLDTEIIFASDIDKFVKQSYFANYDISEDRWYDDVHDINGRKYKGKIDLLVGGSPCQSFSIVGKRRGLKDTRGTLSKKVAGVTSEVLVLAAVSEDKGTVLLKPDFSVNNGDIIL